MGPCHHGIARSQVAGGGTFSTTECSCQCIEYAIADSRQGVVLQLGARAKCQQLLAVKTGLVMKEYMHLGPRQIIWYDLMTQA
jgi:hypothetical protein